MISPRGDDDMLAQVWSLSEYLFTYFTDDTLQNEAMNKIRKSKKVKRGEDDFVGLILLAILTDKGYIKWVQG